MTLGNINRPLHATLHEQLNAPTERGGGTRPFITISRQAGVSGRTLAHLLVNRLNEVDPEKVPWTYWDRELVEKVAQETQLTVQEVQSLEDSGRSWLVELLGNVSLSDRNTFHDEYVVYRRVARTVRGLAMKGRVVIVGRGGAYITAGLPGGVHLRLVALLSYRVEAMARKQDISPALAKKMVKELDDNREAFCWRYFHAAGQAADAFTATFNAGALAPAQIVACILPMLGLYDHHGSSGVKDHHAAPAVGNSTEPLTARGSR